MTGAVNSVLEDCELAGMGGIVDQERIDMQPRAGVLDHEDAVYDPALLSRRFCLPTNVRLWLKADVLRAVDFRPLQP